LILIGQVVPKLWPFICQTNDRTRCYDITIDVTILFFFARTGMHSFSSTTCCTCTFYLRLSKQITNNVQSVNLQCKTLNSKGTRWSAHTSARLNSAGFVSHRLAGSGFGPEPVWFNNFFFRLLWEEGIIKGSQQIKRNRKSYPNVRPTQTTCDKHQQFKSNLPNKSKKTRKPRQIKKERSCSVRHHQAREELQVKWTKATSVWT